MKYMVISDIHGNINNLKKVLCIYKQEKCNKLIILGDLLDYDINNDTNIINILNNKKDEIICVSGNCDININNNLFEMPNITNINLNDKLAILTHGHLYSESELLNMDCDIIILECIRGDS